MKKQPKKGKKGYQQPEEIVPSKIKMPYKRNGEMFGRVVEIYGQERMQVFCEDGKHRIGRIRGESKIIVWVRVGDLVIINPWSFETEVQGKLEKCEISWRYLKPEISWLSRKEKIPEILGINNIPI